MARPSERARSAGGRIIIRLLGGRRRRRVSAGRKRVHAATATAAKPKPAAASGRREQQRSCRQNNVRFKRTERRRIRKKWSRQREKRKKDERRPFVAELRRAPHSGNCEAAFLLSLLLLLPLLPFFFLSPALLSGPKFSSLCCPRSLRLGALCASAQRTNSEHLGGAECSSSRQTRAGRGKRISYYKLGPSAGQG